MIQSSRSACLVCFLLCLLVQTLCRHHISRNIDEEGLVNSTITVNKRYVLWLCKAGWESDFLQEVFPAPVYEHMNHANFMAFHNGSASFKPKVFVYNIENGHTDSAHDYVLSLIQRFKPAVLVHLSDEFMGDTGRKWRFRLGSIFYKLVPLVLRSYSIFPYRSYAEPSSNVIQLPLGYISGMLTVNDSNQIVKLLSTDAARYSLSRNSSDRNLSWSFVGGVKGHKERYHAIEVFNKWTPNFVSHALASTEMRKVYNDSRFVLIGRGQVNLDCFRIYEALISGAIPVVVGPPHEAKLAFEFEGDNPPFLFADSYDAALAKSQNMTLEEIDRQRVALVTWFVDRMAFIRRRVDHYTGLF